MSNIEVDPQAVINNLLEINKQLTLQNAMLRSVIAGSLPDDETEEDETEE